VSGAKNVLVSDESTSADMSISAEAKGDLPGELSVSGINAVNNTASGSLLTALLESRSGGDQKHDERANEELHFLW